MLRFLENLSIHRAYQCNTWRKTYSLFPWEWNFFYTHFCTRTTTFFPAANSGISLDSTTYLINIQTWMSVKTLCPPSESSHDFENILYISEKLRCPDSSAPKQSNFRDRTILKTFRDRGGGGQLFPKLLVSTLHRESFVNYAEVANDVYLKQEPTWQVGFVLPCPEYLQTEYGRSTSSISRELCGIARAPFQIKVILGISW